MHWAACASNYRFKDLGLVGDVRVVGGSAFCRTAVAEQAGGHTPEVVLPLRDNWPPGGSGAARSGCKHEGRARSAFAVVDAMARALENGFAKLCASDLGRGANHGMIAGTAGTLRAGFDLV
jgi:hypothetical protein